MKWNNGMDDQNRGNCVQWFKGAWWCHNCHSSNLNCLYHGGLHSYADGVIWNLWTEYNYSLKFSEMETETE